MSFEVLKRRPTIVTELRRQVPDRFADLKKRADRILERQKLPTDSINVGAWARDLGIDRNLFEYLCYTGFVPKLDREFRQFRGRTLEDIVNFQVPTLLHNAALIVRARKAQQIEVPFEEGYFARKALDLTQPQEASRNPFRF